MAKDLRNKPNTEAATGKFPYGQIQDETANQDGTPVDKEVYQDLHIFFQKLMDEAGITFNGDFENEDDGYQFWEAFIKLAYETKGSSLDIQGGSLPLGNHIYVSDVTENVFVVSDPNSNGPLQSINDLAGYSDFRTIVLFFNDQVQISSAGNLDVGLSFYDVQTNTPYVFRKYGTEWYLESSIQAVLQILSDNYALKSLEARKDEADCVSGYENGWDGGGVSNMTFYKNEFGEVCLEGRVTGGSDGAVAFQLPNGYRPPNVRYFNCSIFTVNGNNYIEISSNGEVRVTYGSNNSVTYLDGVRFRT